MENKDFLQSEIWRKFQKSVRRKIYCITGDDFYASIIKHNLPLVGDYFYIPKGPVMQISNFPASPAGGQFPISNQIQNPNEKINSLVNLAKEENIGWIRIEPKNNESLEIIRNAVEINGNKLKIVRAPHNMQPKEIFVIDITKNEEDLLANMKPKTRYNVKLAEKRGVKIFNFQFSNSNDKIKKKKYTGEFLRLNKIMAARQNIKTHPDEYYGKMLEAIPAENLKLYVAEYKNEVIAANIMVFYGKTAIYLHGASDDKYKNLMAPHLLQWQAIKDAKEMGYEKYDMGGIKTRMTNDKFPMTNQVQMSNIKCQKKLQANSWQGITRFKTGFSPNTKPTEFPGSHDIVLDSKKYFLYRTLQKIKGCFRF